jgi:predicted DNA-binding transcriptional regulator AlpA
LSSKSHREIYVNNNQNKYLNEKEVKEITGIALSTLRNHRSLGKGIPYSKIYRSIKYSLSDVNEFMESRKIRFDDELKRRKEGKL